MPESTDAERENRLLVLSEHITDLNTQRKKFTRKDLLQFLKKKKFKTSKTNLIRDLEYLANNNKFVQNLGMNYSQYMENVSQMYDFVEQEALKIYNQKWTQSKTTKKETTTKEVVGPKLAALKLIADVAKQRAELASGRNLELSAAMWIVKAEEYRKEIERLKSLLPNQIEGVIKVDS